VVNERRKPAHTPPLSKLLSGRANVLVYQPEDGRGPRIADVFYTH